MKKKKENNVQFRRNGFSAKAVTALVTGILTVIVFLVLVFWTAIKEETPQAFAVCATARPRSRRLSGKTHQGKSGYFGIAYRF